MSTFISVSLQLPSEDSKNPARFKITPTEWQGNKIRFLFEDQYHDNAGYFEFDGQSGQIAIAPQKPYTHFQSESQSKAYFLPILASFTNYYHFGWSPAPEKLVNYDADYHNEYGYLLPDALDRNYKTIQAKLIGELANPRRVLVAGCSSGELVSQLRKIEIDSYGFDVIPNLPQHALPDVKPFLKEGSITQIPFEASDNLDTFVAIDVLEHIPECDLPKMISEWQRLNIQKLVLLINLNEFSYTGHITMRPLDWWAAQWKSQFKQTRCIRINPRDCGFDMNSDYNHQLILWERL